MSTPQKGDRAGDGAITLRPTVAVDHGFMRGLHASTCAEEMKRFPLDEAQKRAFLDQQFVASSSTAASTIRSA